MDRRECDPTLLLHCRSFRANDATIPDGYSTYTRYLNINNLAEEIRGREYPEMLTKRIRNMISVITLLQTTSDSLREVSVRPRFGGCFSLMAVDYDFAKV
jgi:hypothetical protein